MLCGKLFDAAGLCRRTHHTGNRAARQMGERGRCRQQKAVPERDCQTENKRTAALFAPQTQDSGLLKAGDVDGRFAIFARRSFRSTTRLHISSWAWRCASRGKLGITKGIRTGRSSRSSPDGARIQKKIRQYSLFLEGFAKSRSLGSLGMTGNKVFRHPAKRDLCGGRRVPTRLEPPWRPSRGSPLQTVSARRVRTDKRKSSCSKESCWQNVFHGRPACNGVAPARMRTEWQDSALALAL